MKKPAHRHTSFETIRRAALALPEVAEGTAWGFPAFRRDGQLFLCFRKDLDSIVLRTSFEQRDEMIEENPATYYTTEHHRDYPWVLARIAYLDAQIVADLVRLGWQSVAQKKRRAGAR
ncbi:MAG TPA: MmcQ/YjbR family DNA-binding protein [Bryobacteraceae bacterium]|nr:MmcQ/YjbR family DNA-binding protein [Bryobacteraceae bacterium]